MDFIEYGILLSSPLYIHIGDEQIDDGYILTQTAENIYPCSLICAVLQT